MVTAAYPSATIHKRATFTAIASTVMNAIKSTDEKETTWPHACMNAAGSRAKSTGSKTTKSALFYCRRQTIKSDSDFTEAVEILTAVEQPSTRFVESVDLPPSVEREDEKEGKFRVWTVRNRRAHTILYRDYDDQKKKNKKKTWLFTSLWQNFVKALYKQKTALDLYLLKKWIIWERNTSLNFIFTWCKLVQCS